MFQKTALSVYRTIVLTGIGFIAGAVTVTYAAEKTGRLKPRLGRQDDKNESTEPKTTY
jgi:hypothetical protein